MKATGTAVARVLALQAFILASVLIWPAAAQQQSASEVLEYKGTVVAAQEAEVAPRLDGLLVKINFTAGQFVKKGDLLFEFASRDREISLALAQADSKQAEADLRLVERRLENAQTLRSRNVASEMEFLKAEAERDVSAAKAEKARANVQLSELALEEMKLYAPIDGVIGSPLVNEGSYITKEVRQQSRLATIARLSPIRVVGRVPASVYFQRGVTITSIEQATEQREFGLVLPTGDKYPHKGRAVAGDYQFDPETQTVEVTVEFPNPNLLLRPGLSVVLQSSIRDK